MSEKLNCLHCGTRTQLCADGTYRKHRLPNLYPLSLCPQSRKPYSPHGTRYTLRRPYGERRDWLARCLCGEWEFSGSTFEAVRDAWAEHAGFGEVLSAIKTLGAA